MEPIKLWPPEPGIVQLNTSVNAESRAVQKKCAGNHIRELDRLKSSSTKSFDLVAFNLKLWILVRGAELKNQ